jgi:hypothetical protein
MLERAYGPERAQEILAKLTRAMQMLPFDSIKRVHPAQLSTFLQDEHPQTIALVLAYLDPQAAAAVLGSLPPELRPEVAERLATMGSTPPEVIRRVENVLQRKLSSLASQELTAAGGVKSLVEVIQWVDRNTERMIFDYLTDNNPELAEEVRKLMFTFEDLLQLDDRAIQQILKEVDMKELALALKGASDALKDKIFPQHVRARDKHAQRGAGVYGTRARARCGGGAAADCQHRAAHGGGGRNCYLTRRRGGDAHLNAITFSNAGASRSAGDSLTGRADRAASRPLLSASQPSERPSPQSPFPEYTLPTGAQMPDLDAVRAEAEAIRLKAIQDAERIREQARREGYQRGYDEGYHDGEQQAHQHADAELQRTLETLRAQLQQVIESVHAQHEGVPAARRIADARTRVGGRP